ncbi:MAG TPA: UvrD-helicase domain-containing protein [Capillimicrobium sp.]|nr:UvrD-helicase domain-containing protein [Capillimicrobium sp.]
MPSPAADRVEELLAGLNEPQRSAVTHPGGPLLILAGAGSGKTRVLTHRLAWLVHTGQVGHHEVLAITFTNKAAQEMRERVELLLGRRTRGMWVMTFHAACARMLRAEAPRLGYTRQFTIYDQADARRLVKHCLEEHGHDTKRYTPAAIHNQISDSKNRLRDAEAYRQLVGSRFEEVVADTYESYERELHRMNAMDFDDLLVRAVNVLELFQEVRDRYSSTFKHVLVDEYQDTNHAQYRWLQLLAGEHRNLAVVGDDAQCLVEGTAVTMGDGSVRPIEAVRPGDEVLSCYGSGDFRPARVLRVHRSETVEGVAITLRGGRRIVSTPDHTHFAGHPGDVWRLSPTPRSKSATRPLVALCGAGGGAHTVDGDRVERFRDAWHGADGRYVARFGADGGALPFLQAADVGPGMAMFTADGGYDVVENVERVTLDRPVYDLDVAHTHNFVAEGIVTHNSVYSFRGADIRNILDFQDDFPDATVVKLEQNYRSTQTILDAANAVIRHNRGQIPKELWTDAGAGDPIRVRELDDERAEARFVVGEIERMIDEGAQRQDFAVFYRTNGQSRVLEDEFAKRDVGYQVIGGPKFYDRAEVKDAIAYLSWLANPQDLVSFTRIANSPRRGIGQTSLGRVTAHAATMGISIWDAASDPASVPGLGTAAVKAFTRFMDTMAGLREKAEQNVPIADLLNAVLHETGYLDALKAERTFEAQGRIENLDALVDAASEFDATADPDANTLDLFLQEKALIADADAREDEGLVTLMTLHNAKGLEYDIVFITGLEDGVFPHARALDEQNLEEERRLCYVGITRARRELTLTWARQRMVFGATQYGLRSRFLDEIPLELTDREAGDDVTSAGAGGAPRARFSWDASRAEAPAADSVEFRMGEDVVHAAFGEGVVTGVEPGGIVVIRFARDGSERKLMAEYAPISRR